MVKRISTAKLKSDIRKAERQTKKAVNDYNRQVRKTNRLIDDYNREIRKVTHEFNRAAREYNAEVKKARRIINREIQRQSSSTRIVVTTEYDKSAFSMLGDYAVVSNTYPEGIEVNSYQNEILDLVENEQANGLITTSSVFGSMPIEQNTKEIEIKRALASYSEDLADRWVGAIYSLNPDNPDATRHFCTSARELFTLFIEMNAPDDAVFRYNENAQRTDRGNATRKEKIRFMMRDSGLDESVVDFADSDIENILQLFRVLSDGTHGKAGRYTYQELMQIRRRVEHGINFLCTIAGNKH